MLKRGWIGLVYTLTTNNDVELLLDSWNEKLCKNPLNVTLVQKGVTINDDIGKDSDEESDDDGGDFCLHDVGGEMHDTFFDVDFLETNEIEVGTSRTKLPVIRNVEAIGVESDRVSAVLAEGVSHPADGVSQSVEGVSQPA